MLRDPALCSCAKWPGGFTYLLPAFEPRRFSSHKKGGRGRPWQGGRDCRFGRAVRQKYAESTPSEGWSAPGKKAELIRWRSRALAIAASKYPLPAVCFQPKPANKPIF